MKVPTGFIQDLKAIDRNLSAIFNGLLERFQIVWTDPRTNKTKIVQTVENDDGTYRHCDKRAVLHAAETVSWNTLYKYPDVKDMEKHFLEQRAKAITKKNELRDDYRKWWNKEHKKEWAAALENAKRGIFVRPEEKTKKIMVEVKLPKRFSRAASIINP